MKRLKKAIVLALIFFSVSIFGITFLPNYVQANDGNTNAQVQDEEYENYSKDYKKYLALSDEEKAKVEVIPLKYDVTLEEFWNNYNRIYPEKKAITKSSLLKQATIGTIPTQYCLSNKYNYSGNAGINIQAESQVGGTCWNFATIMTLQTSIARQTNSTTYPRLSNAHLDYLNSKYSSTPYGNDRNIGKGGPFLKEYLFRLEGPVLEENCEYIDNKNGNVYVKVNGTRKEYITETEETITDEEIKEIREECASEMQKLKPSYYVHEVIEFPSIEKKVLEGGITYKNSDNVEIPESEVLEVRNAIKEHIMEKGGVYSSIRTNEKFSAVKDQYDGTENPSTMVYHFDDGTIASYKCGDHAITIVGWDDNISRDKFGTYVKDGVSYDKEKPVHNGAWLCINSWGTNWSDEGYFWISYDDAKVEGELAGIVSIDQNAPTYTTYTLTNKKAFDKLKEIFTKFGSIKDVNDTTMTMKVSDDTINNIESVNLSECDITDSDLQEIFKKPFKNLKYLLLSSNKLTNITPLLGNKNLINLILDGANINSQNRFDITGISTLS